MSSTTVGKGESYFSIAERIYGDQRMGIELMKANGGVMPQPGMTLTLPGGQSNPLITEGEMSYASGISSKLAAGIGDDPPPPPKTTGGRSANFDARAYNAARAAAGSKQTVTGPGSFSDWLAQGKIHPGGQSIETPLKPISYGPPSPGGYDSSGRLFTGGGQDFSSLNASQRSAAIRFGAAPVSMQIQGAQTVSGLRPSSYNPSEAGSHSGSDAYYLRATDAMRQGALVSGNRLQDYGRPNLVSPAKAGNQQANATQQMLRQQQQQSWAMMDNYTKNARKFLDALESQRLDMMPVEIDMMTANFAGFSVGQLMQMGYEQVGVNAKGQIIYRLKVPIVAPTTTVKPPSSAGGTGPRYSYGGGGGGGGTTSTGRANVSAVSNGLINWRIG